MLSLACFWGAGGQGGNRRMLNWGVFSSEPEEGVRQRKGPKSQRPDTKGKKPKKPVSCSCLSFFTPAWPPVQSDRPYLICGSNSTLQRKKDKKNTLGSDRDSDEFTELNQTKPRSTEPQGCKLVKCERTLQNSLLLAGNIKLASGSGAGLST